jgi:hypothetical protein
LASWLWAWTSWPAKFISSEKDSHFSELKNQLKSTQIKEVARLLPYFEVLKEEDSLLAQG